MSRALRSSNNRAVLLPSKLKLLPLLNLLTDQYALKPYILFIATSVELQT
eukprot:jgi/Psemu1/16556/gm1.16556_g